MLVVALFGWIVLTSNLWTQAFWWEWRWWELHDQVKAAVDANNYALLPAEAQAKIDQEKFTFMVEWHAEKQEHKAQLEAVVQSWNFEAFQALRESHKTLKEGEMAQRLEEKLSSLSEEERTAKKAHIEKMQWRKDLKPQPSEEDMQEKFNEMVTYYNENGELPEKRMKWFWYKWFWSKGDCWEGEGKGKGKLWGRWFKH